MAAQRGAFVWRSFDLGDWRLALTSPRRRRADVRPAEELARAFHALPPEPPYRRREHRNSRVAGAAFGQREEMATALGQPPAGGLALFEDACSVGDGVLIASNGAIIRESISEGKARRGPFRRRSDGGLAARIWPFTPMPRLAGDFIFLRQAGDADYGRWLVEALPRLAIAAQFCDLSQFKIIVSRQGEAMARVVRDSLGLFGVRPEQIVAIGGRPTFFQRLVFPLPVADHPFAKSPRAVEVLESFPARLAGADESPNRIYVIPGPDEARPVNEAEILDELRPLGFTVVAPARMSFSERVRAFSQAERIVGACGPGLSNAVFAPRGVRILALTPPQIGNYEAFLGDLMDVKQGSYFSLPGKSGKDFSIDLAAFESMVVDFF